MVNPDNLAEKIADLVRSGKIQGIADVRDDSSGRTGQRLVVVLRRDAVARVVLNNLLKHTELQTNFSANMLALVDGVPRTLTIDQFISNWVTHQIEVIQRRTRFRLAEAERQAHVYRGLVKALDALDEVIALIRRSPDVEEARTGLMELLEIDEVQAQAILDMQLRRLAALERQKIMDRLAELEAIIADLEDILANEARQRQIIRDELAEIVEKFGNERRTQIIAADGDLSMEDLIPDEDLVVSITRGGYAKRTRADQYRTQKRGGKGVRGASLRGDDVVEHFISTTNHHWLLFFTTAGRVYRTKAYNLPEAQRDAKGGHVAGLLSFQPDESIAQVLAIRDYEQAPYLVLATRNGLVKKTRLGDYNSPRQAGVIAINFREDDDELIGAELVNADDDILLVSRKGQAIRFRADDTQLRPMGRATSGVAGMKFRNGDSLLSMSVIRAAQMAAEEAAEEAAVRRGPVRRGRRGRAARRGEAAVRLHHHRRRLRQALADHRLPPAVPWRPRHQGDVAGQRGPRRAGRRLHRRGRRRGALDHQQRPGRAQPDQRRLPAHRALDDGREVRVARRTVTRWPWWPAPSRPRRSTRSRWPRPSRKAPSTRPSSRATAAPRPRMRRGGVTNRPNRPNRPGMQQSMANPTRKVTPDVRQFEAGDDR